MGALPANLEAELRDAPDDEARSYLLHRHGWWYLNNGRNHLARNVARRMLEMSPRDIDGVVLNGHAALRIGDLAEAQEMLDNGRLLLQGPSKVFYKEEILQLAEAVLERQREEKEREERRRRPRKSRRQQEKPRPVGPSVEVPTPASTEIRLTLDARRLDLPPFEKVGAETALGDYLLRRLAVDVQRLRSFETLIALGCVQGVDHYDYQLRTVRRVLRDFRGRVLLADEVGLGKTVEACLCLKEYILRGLVRRTLIIVPPALTGQWREELEGKFGLEPRLVDGRDATADPDVWGKGSILLTSMGLVRLERHARHLRKVPFDLVIVDEAHRLKNRRTRSWKLVDTIRSRFLLLLSATPVENSLVEIYNVLSLLRPGLFSTQAEFKRTFVGPGQGRTPKDPAQLRSLLREVMIRNTRALSEAHLPMRFAATLRATPNPEEAALYADVSRNVKEALHDGRLGSGVSSEILRAIAACPPSAADLLRRHLGNDLAARAVAVPSAAKDALLIDLLTRRKDEKILLFAGHRTTLEHLVGVVAAAGRSSAIFHGRLSARAKQGAIDAFSREADVLIASESGGEGFNLQFARTVVNYDLPWNPMRIEQRIGRVHRIGQTRDVFVFNLVTAGTLEEEILRVLDEKINMFELVVGEIEAILGRFGDDEKEFSELILDIYVAARDDVDLRARFDDLAEDLSKARGEYVRVKEFEEEIFGRDLEA